MTLDGAATGSSPGRGLGHMDVAAGMNRARGCSESGDARTALTGQAATHKTLPPCKEKAVIGFESRLVHLAHTGRSADGVRHAKELSSRVKRRVKTEIKRPKWTGRGDGNVGVRRGSTPQVGTPWRQPRWTRLSFGVSRASMVAIGERSHTPSKQHVRQ